MANLSTPRAPIASEHCGAAIARFERIISNRGNFDAVERGGMRLGSPACAQACLACYMECAIAPERLAWWRNELAMAEAHEGGGYLQHDGHLFLTTAGRA